MNLLQTRRVAAAPGWQRVQPHILKENPSTETSTNCGGLRGIPFRIRKQKDTSTHTCQYILIVANNFGYIVRTGSPTDY